MQNYDGFVDSLGVSGLYFFILGLSIIPILAAMILRGFCFHREAITYSKIAAVMSVVTIVLKIGMFEATSDYCFSTILNMLALCISGIALSFNGFKKWIEYDPPLARLWIVFISILYIGIVYVLFTA